MKNSNKSQSGQIALIVLLVMSLTLVIALSMARRTTKDVSQTTQLSESAQVYSAAQSVAEEQLNNVLTTMREGGTVLATSPMSGGRSEGESSGGEQETLNDAYVDSQIETPSTFIQPLAQGEVIQVAPADESLILEWGSSDNSCEDASILISEYYEQGGESRVKYSAFAPTGCNNPRSDGIVAGNSGTELNTRVNLSLESSVQFVRIIPLYSDADLYVEGAASGSFVRILARAVNARGDEEETSNVEVTSTNLQAPGFLDYALYSGDTIVKQ